MPPKKSQDNTDPKVVTQTSGKVSNSVTGDGSNEEEIFKFIDGILKYYYSKKDREYQARIIIYCLQYIGGFLKYENKYSGFG